MRTTTREARQNIRQYIIDIYNGEDYGYKETNDFKQIATNIYNTFYDEYIKHNKYINKSYYNLFFDWCQGLPSIIDTCYYYNRSAVADVAKILEETPEEASKYTESQAEQLLTHLIYREIDRARARQ